MGIKKENEGKEEAERNSLWAAREYFTGRKRKSTKK